MSYIALSGMAILAAWTVLAVGCNDAVERHSANEERIDESAEQGQQRLGVAATEAVKKREADIRSELQRLTDHDWAGQYYQGDGLGANLSLTVAPEAGAIFRLRGCGGLYDQDHGGITEQQGVLKIAWKLDRKVKKGDPPTELLLVRWSQRRYLVPIEEIARFCAAVRSGLEPRKERQGFYYLRLGDETKPTSGQPELPKGFDPCLTR
jgi:hypothetical protein